MSNKTLRCNQCKKNIPMQNVLKCECGGIFDIVFEAKASLYPDNPKTFWDYFELLPLEDRKNIVSISEPFTPLIKTENTAEQLHCTNLYIKDETRQTTGSFKDRPNAIAVSKAKEFGLNTITVASSGNASSSAAAYAAKAGLQCVVFVPESTPVGKLCQAYTYGAKIIKVPGNYSNSYNLALEASKIFNWYNVTSTYLNPYTVEGDKVAAYEIFEILKNVPDYIFIPIGSGPLLHGMLKGFEELKQMGLTTKIPKMVCVQAEKCNPIVDAFKNNRTIVEAINNISYTIASGINDPLIGYSEDGTKTLSRLKESMGCAIDLNENEIQKSVEMLARNEGIFSEPAGAVGIGAVEKLTASGVIEADALKVVMITGNGLKNTEYIDIQSIPTISTLSEIEQIIF